MFTDEHVEHDFLGLEIIKADILGNRCAPLSVTLDAVDHSTSVGALMTGQTVFADVDAMIFGGEVESFAELELGERILGLVRQP